jgi:hypothetical protein
MGAMEIAELKDMHLTCKKALAGERRWDIQA